VGRRIGATGHTARRRVVCVLAAAALLGGSTGPSVAAAPGTRTCGHFFSKGQDIIVLDRGPVSCKRATSIIRAFSTGAGVTMHGTSDATGYFTIRAWPGWRCYQAAGSGECKRHAATASYEVKGKF
jgi:hypothetical protein